MQASLRFLVRRRVAHSVGGFLATPLCSSLCFASVSSMDTPLRCLRVNFCESSLEPKLDIFDTSKQEIVQRFGVELRDLRVVTNTAKEASRSVSRRTHRYTTPEFFVRHGAFIAHLGPLSALISAHECILFNQPSEIAKDKFVSTLRLTLNETQKSSSTPFEIHCLEALCKAVVSNHRRKLNDIADECEALIGGSLRDKSLNIGFMFYGGKTDSLAALKKSLAARIASMRALVKEFQGLLSNETDMALMLLSANSGSRKENLEVLLENYLWQFEEILEDLRLLLDEVQMNEQTVGYILDRQRNQIMRVNLQLTVMTCAFSYCALNASLFGMNLLSHLESHPQMFYVVAATFGALFPFSIYRYFKYRLKQMDIAI